MEARPARRTSFKSGAKEMVNNSNAAAEVSESQASNINLNNGGDNGLVSDSPVPEVPVFIEQIESNDKIAYKITEANAVTEATIIEVPNENALDKVKETRECVVTENGIQSKNQLKESVQTDQEEKEEEKKSGELEEASIKEEKNEKLAGNKVEKKIDVVESVSKEESEAVKSMEVADGESKPTSTPRSKRGKRRGDDLSIDFTPVKKDTPIAEDDPSKNLTRSRYGRVQKTKTPNPEMITFDAKRRSSIKSNISNDDQLSGNKQSEDEKKETPELDEKKGKAKKETPRVKSPVKESGRKRKSNALQSKTQSPPENEIPSTSLDATPKMKQALNVDDIPQKKSIELQMGQSKQLLSFESLTAIPPKEGDFMVGDLIWAKEHGYPWWPCMISIDPIEHIYSKLSGASYKSDRVYHIQYFGSQPLRGWTHLGMIMPFEGRAKYFEKIEALKLGSPKSQTAKITAKFAIKPSQKKDWELSVMEAERAAKLDSESRVKNYTFDYTFTSKQTPKRKASSDHTTPASQSKRLKASSSSPEDVYDFDEEEDNFDGECQGTPVLTWKRRINQLGDFSVYCKKELNKFKSEYPKVNANELHEIMKRKWDLLSDDLKSQYMDRPAVVESQAFDATPIAATIAPMVKVQAKKTTTPKTTTPKTITPKTTASKTTTPASSTPARKRNVRAKGKAESPIEDKDKVDETPENDVELKDADSDSDGQLVINETLPKKKSAKKPVKGKKSPDASDQLQDKTSVPEIPAVAAVVAATTPKRTKKEIEQKSAKSKSNTKAQSKAVPQTEVSKEKQSELPKHVDTPMKPVAQPGSLLGLLDLDEFASGEETSSTSEAENMESSKAEQPKFCGKCYESDEGNYLTCHGECMLMFHEKCVGKKVAADAFKCEECESGKHSCFVCKKTGDEETIKCSDKHCGKFYHVSCLANSKSHPVKFSNEAKNSFICPLHFCLHCHIETEGKKEFRPLKRRIVKCVMCPTAYHLGDYCIAAGTTTIAQNCVICPEHYQDFIKKKKQKEKHLNVNWCFSCLQGGELVCCEACPAAFHESCLDYKPDPALNFYCGDCNLRKQFHYNDIVWVKLGFYRWWPGRVTHPKSVPDNVMNIEHTVGQFPVYFFGSHDYYWVHKGRCFLFAEGDNKAAANSSASGKSNKSLVKTFKNGMAEAVTAFEELQSDRSLLRTAMLSNKPPAYIHIKSNKPVVQKAQPSKSDKQHCNRCECDPQSEAPCSTDSCLNRSLMTECDQKTCKAGDRCMNQQFQKRQYIKTKPFKTDKAGWGLKSLENISKGQFVIEYVGELVDEKECERRLKEMGENSVGKFYFLTIDKDNIIDAGPKGNLARFMNHSCQPNCETQKWMVSGTTRVGLFAVCDIPPGSELTFNYNLDCRGNEKTVCHCGSANCSGFIGVRPIKSDEGNSKSQSAKKDKKKKQNGKHFAKRHDDECFTCGERGELIMCDRKGCPKSFHLSCLNIETIPEGKWDCPCHYCVTCKKPAKLMCSCCHISLCKDHEKDDVVKMTQLPDGSLLCSAHQMNEDVNGVLIAPEVNSLGEENDEEEIELARSGDDGALITGGETMVGQELLSPLDVRLLPTGDSPALTSDCLHSKGTTIGDNKTD